MLILIICIFCDKIRANPFARPSKFITNPHQDGFTITENSCIAIQTSENYKIFHTLFYNTPEIISPQILHIITAGIPILPANKDIFPIALLMMQSHLQILIRDYPDSYMRQSLLMKKKPSTPLVTMAILRAIHDFYVAPFITAEQQAAIIKNLEQLTDHIKKYKTLQELHILATKLSQQIRALQSLEKLSYNQIINTIFLPLFRLTLITHQYAECARSPVTALEKYIGLSPEQSNTPDNQISFLTQIMKTNLPYSENIGTDEEEFFDTEAEATENDLLNRYFRIRLHKQVYGYNLTLQHIFKTLIYPYWTENNPLIGEKAASYMEKFHAIYHQFPKLPLPDLAALSTDIIRTPPRTADIAEQVISLYHLDSLLNEKFCTTLQIKDALLDLPQDQGLLKLSLPTRHLFMKTHRCTETMNIPAKSY